MTPTTQEELSLELGRLWNEYEGVREKLCVEIGAEFVPQGSDPCVPPFPHQDGPFIVLGPDIFASEDGKVICWKGENYVPQEASDE